MTRHSFATAALIAAILSVQCPTTHAQVQRSGGEQQKFMQQYQQLAAEKTALQAQIAQMKKDLDSASAALAAMKKERDTLKARPAGISPTVVAQATASKDAAERSLSESKQRLTELVGRFRETAANLKEVEADRGKLRAELEASNNAFDKCAVDNQQLFDINGAVLDRLAHVGLFTKVSAEEPFTRITRTRMDNLVVETRARAEELRVKRRSP